MKKPSVLFAVGALVLVLSGCGVSSGAPTAADKPEASKAAESGTTPKSSPSDSKLSFVDGVLTTRKIKVVITDHKVIPVGAEGNEYGTKPVIAFWYELTNLTDAKASPSDWLFVFKAYQDNNPNAVNELSVGMLPDARFLETQLESIKNGGTVQNAVAYELDDETTPVDLVASDNLGQTEIGRVTYALN
jgi:hypothetical protein